jgi:hypothetical protein
MSIQVKREIYFLEKVNTYSIRMTSVEPYGRYHPQYICVTGIFNKNLEKCKQEAWLEFMRKVDAQDCSDRMYDGKITERFEVGCERCPCHK